jgi:hypothetical protein
MTAPRNVPVTLPSCHVRLLPCSHTSTHKTQASEHSNQTHALATCFKHKACEYFCQCIYNHVCCWAIVKHD